MGLKKMQLNLWLVFISNYRSARHRLATIHEHDQPTN